MRVLVSLLLVLVGVVATACTNDYGAFHFPPPGAGGASGEGGASANAN